MSESKRVKISKREGALMASLAAKEQEVYELQACARDLYRARRPVTDFARQVYTDPAINVEFQLMTAQLGEMENALRLRDAELQELRAIVDKDESAKGSRSDANTGPRGTEARTDGAGANGGPAGESKSQKVSALLARCQRLEQENEELAASADVAKVAQLSSEKAVGEAYAGELKTALEEAYEYIEQLEEEREVKTHKVYALEEALRSATALASASALTSEAFSQHPQDDYLSTQEHDDPVELKHVEVMDNVVHEDPWEKQVEEMQEQEPITGEHESEQGGDEEEVNQDEESQGGVTQDEANEEEVNQEEEDEVHGVQQRESPSPAQPTAEEMDDLYGDMDDGDGFAGVGGDSIEAPVPGPTPMEEDASLEQEFLETREEQAVENKEPNVTDIKEPEAEDTREPEAVETEAQMKEEETEEVFEKEQGLAETDAQEVFEIKEQEVERPEEPPVEQPKAKKEAEKPPARPLRRNARRSSRK